MRQTFNPNFSKAALITSVTVVCAVTGIILNVPAALYQVCYQMVILPHVVVKVRGKMLFCPKITHVDCKVDKIGDVDTEFSVRRMSLNLQCKFLSTER